MDEQIRFPIQSDGLEPTDTDLLANPLDFIAKDHLLIRSVCAEMERLVQSQTVDPKTARRILSFLEDELPLLIQDEDEDLFPLLLRRSQPEDDMQGLGVRLDAEHSGVMNLIPAITAIFGDLAIGKNTLDDPDRAKVTSFSAHMRRHLIFENAIVLPFARLRLTAQDLETLRLRMRDRRNVLQEETPDAR